MTILHNIRGCCTSNEPTAYDLCNYWRQVSICYNYSHAEPLGRWLATSSAHHDVLFSVDEPFSVLPELKMTVQEVLSCCRGSAEHAPEI